MSDLDALVTRARNATVDRAAAERYVDELDRWARPAARPRRWVPWLAASALVAAAAIALVLWRGQHDEPVTAVWIGDQVAIVAAPATGYRVVRAGPDDTEIAVERGAVTARLWRGRPHRLALSGGGVTATATGTVYSLAITPGGPVVAVVEGAVEVRATDGLHVVAAGATWPAARVAADPEAARTLLALADPALRTDSATPIDAGAPAPPSSAVGGAAPGDAEASADAGLAPPATSRPAPAPAAPTVKDRWRSVRLLRAQGRFSPALAECMAIADARDPTWSPIALIEAVRIELGPLAHPEQAIALADRMIREWPSDALVPEARELRCRALRQLGRGAECARTPAP
jgi:hypothetical protein